MGNHHGCFKHHHSPPSTTRRPFISFTRRPIAPTHMDHSSDLTQNLSSTTQIGLNLPYGQVDSSCVLLLVKLRALVISLLVAFMVLFILLLLLLELEKGYWHIAIVSQLESEELRDAFHQILNGLARKLPHDKSIYLKPGEKLINWTTGPAADLKAW